MKSIILSIACCIVTMSEASDTCEVTVSVEHINSPITIPCDLENRAIILQTFSAEARCPDHVFIYQQGKNNSAYVIQSGQMNQSVLLQYGSDNTGSQKTTGGENILLLYQQGQRNRGIQEVVGNNNSMRDYQVGNDNLLEHVITGTGNNCRISQYGNNKEIKIIDGR